MRPRLSASISWAILLMPAWFAISSPAQINGVPSSVTSTGFGGRRTNGTPASVTSLGPRGYAPRAGTPGTVPFAHPGGMGHHRRHRDGDFFSPLYYAVPVPYAVETAAPDAADANDAEEYQGGPTLFDRRGSGERSYIPPVQEATAAAAPVQEDSPPAAPEPVQSTLLIFKDGHNLEVGNYAIVGATLFDLTPGHPRKIPLADLDVEATRKENDDRGIVFQFPSSLSAN
ncbi:MAG TPA: hypothetical protein VFD30_21975 [Terriglobia bacterium]|nr:hypothetical protein [Terriglobia bacterium]